MRSKKAKKIRISGSQMDIEAPGGFMKPDEEEEKRIIEGKYKQRVEIQNQLIEANVGQNYAWVEASELEQIYKNYDEPLYCGKKELSINPKFVDKPLWYGIDMPKKLLACEFNTKIQIYKRAMMKYNYLYSALKELGFTKDILHDLIVNGKIVSDNDTLKKLEEDYNKTKLARDDVDVV